MLIDNPSEWLGTSIRDYELRSILGSGRIGYVFLGVHKQVPQLKRAYKIIAEGQLKDGWQHEIIKVGQLSSCPEVARVLEFDSAMDAHHRPYSYIAYDYVDGTNLREYLSSVSNDVSLTFVVSVLTSLLRIHYACQTIGFQHGDLHEGNILVTKPDALDPYNERRIIITDFGYGGSHNQLAPKDDIAQIVAIGCNLLNRLNRDALQATERLIRERLLVFLKKELNETYRLAGNRHSADGQTALHEFLECIAAAKQEAAATGQGIAPSVDDYLNAETLGYRKAEWQNLFVPEILGEPAFVGRNVTVITGARGCGKTMAFRRLTLYLDELIGSTSGVKGSDGFVGFYMNCRDLVEVFPYVPARLPEIKARQIRHFFHLCWLQDIVKGFQQRALREPDDYRWLVNWVESEFGEKIETLWTKASDAVVALAHFIENKKEECARLPSGKKTRWALEDVDTLDKLYDLSVRNIGWLAGRPFYFYLDDYTIPLISQHMQAALNPIVFKRRPNVFFKISTEATNSFLRMSHQKPLEVNHDFDFVDLASETLSVTEDVKERLLSGILSRRLRRIEQFRDDDHDLRAVLGESEWKSYNELARRLREGKLSSADPIYYGYRAFVGMWSSDIRSMIQVFNELLRSSQVDEAYRIPIERTIQHRRFSESGGEFLSVTENLRVGGFWDDDRKAGFMPKEIGAVLRDVAQAFIAVSRYELMEGQLIDNQGALAPRQAIRIEIVDEFNLSDRARKIYQALLRWHVFLPDWRGRSVRGFMVPRLFLNRRLIPYARLSFSGKDSISLRSEEFEHMLLAPQSFEKYWRGKARRGKDKNTDGQIGLGLE